jgi:nitrogen regulatory protein PII-like uncharacterized protein
MKKTFVKRNSPLPFKVNNSVKENQTVRITPDLEICENFKGLIQKNECDLTERINSRNLGRRVNDTADHGSRGFSRGFNNFRGVSPASDSNQSVRENIFQIRESIGQILDESVQTTSQIKKLKEKLETNYTALNNSTNRPDFDESSILSPTQSSFSSHIQDLKSQLSLLSQKLSNREEKIHKKHKENLFLQFQIFSLSHKLEKLKSKSLKKSKICEIF